MKLNLRVSWIRELKNKALVDDWRWSAPEKWAQVAIEDLRETDLDELLELMEKHKDVKGSIAVKQKIKTYRKLLTDARGVKISRLEPLVMAIKMLMKPTPHKWLFSENKDGYLVPWYVYDVRYNPPNERTGDPASTEVNLAAIKRGSKQTQSIYFYSGGLGDTAYELLRKKGYFVETAEIVEDYAKENLRYQAICGLTGEQFLATGTAESSGYYSRTTSMLRDGEPTRVVMDDDSDDGDSRSDNERIQITAKFWLETTDEDDGGAAAEASVVDLPLQPYVKVFDLKKHNFCEIHAANLENYVYDETLFDKLIIPADRKELVEILVSGAELELDDIVQGKTGGKIVISTGPPGTGKTLTAEVFSERVKRPLYCVQCSQLGTDEETLEKELRTVLSRAERWKAILLIDEADVYVHARGNDIQQNAIVGVFLRVLEYYQGILFLTSNRETVIDDAIMSRGTAWFRYDLPDESAAIHIWSVLSTQYAIKLNEFQIKELASTKFPGISGRSIKNMLKLAKMFAHSKRKPVTVDMLVYVSQFLPLEGKEKEHG